MYVRTFRFPYVLQSSELSVEAPLEVLEHAGNVSAQDASLKRKYHLQSRTVSDKYCNEL